MSAENEVQENIVMDLGALLDAREGAIVTLVAGDTRLAAHKAVLAARSPAFEAMFLQDAAESSSGQLDIPDLEGAVLRQLLAYVYTGEVPQLASVAPRLLAAADKFSLGTLKARCELQVVRQLCVENAASAAVLAIKHSCPTLTESAVAFIRGHTHRVMASQGWADAVLNSPKEVIELHHLLADQPPESREPTTRDSSDSSPPPTTPPDSGHSQPPAAAATDPHVVSQVREPPTTDASAAPTAPPDSGHRESPAAAAPDPQLLSQVRNLPAREKSWRVLEAAKGGSLELLRALLASGAETGYQDWYWWTALHYAADRGDVQAVECLLNSGAEVDVKNLDNKTPLHLAALKNHPAVVKVLAASGADVNARAAGKWTPLHCAAVYGHAEAVTALLEVGADRNARKAGGETPLQAARYAAPHNMQQLLDILR